MMNQIVVQFVMDNQSTKTVSMVMCEKVVLGYCALNHLLLLLQSKNRKTVTQYANNMVHAFINQSTHKNQCKDLGKFLIWLMLSSKYQWNDVAKLFVQEVFTRNVRWMVRDQKYSHFNTTKHVSGRLQGTFEASKISRRLVMFQVWFMKNTATQTLKGYNERLGRPQTKVRNGVGSKTKFILNSTKWSDYFNELDVVLKDEKAIDQLLRFAVYNSKKMGYHRDASSMKAVKSPPMRVTSTRYVQPQYADEGAVDTNVRKVGISIGGGRGRGWNNVRGSGWRGRGRGRGRGCGGVQMQAQNGRGNGSGFGTRGRGMSMRPMSNQNSNVNRNNQTPPNAPSHSTQQPPQRQQQQQQPGMPTQVRPEANTQNIAASQPVPGSSRQQNNVNTRGNVDTTNLSKAQRKRLRKRLAKERRKAEA